MDRLPVGRGIVKDLSCLNPQLQKADQGMQAVQRTARRLPQIVTEEALPLLNDEWKVYQAQDIPEDWYILGHKEDGTIGRKFLTKRTLQEHRTTKYLQS